MNIRPTGSRPSHAWGSYERGLARRQRAAALRGEKNFLHGEEAALDVVVPLRQWRERLDQGEEPGILSEMTLEDIRSMQENVWRQARGSIIPPNPSTALFGAEEALAMDNISRQLQVGPTSRGGGNTGEGFPGRHASTRLPQ